MRILPLTLLLSAMALPALAQQPQPSAAQLRLRMLSWPGKVQPAAPRQAQPMPRATQAQPTAQAVRDPAWRTAYRPLPHGSSHMLGDLTPAQSQAVASQRAADAEQAEKAKALLFAQEQKEKQAQAQVAAQSRTVPVRPGPALPTSIYAPAPPTGQARAPWTSAPREPEAVAVASAYDQKAHYYSLHRAYGQQPDPIALSQQFLSTPSADLADPPPPPAPRILPNSTATAAQQTAARVQQRESSDSGS
jgi:hypothetical protein